MCSHSMFKTNDLGNICHEHLEYYSLKSIKYIFDKVGFKIIDLEFNDVDQLEKAFKFYKNKIACVIVEPIAGNMNFIPASNVFLNKLRDLTKKTKSVLILFLTRTTK